MLRRKKCQKLYHVSLVVGNKYWLTKTHTSLVSMQKSPFIKKIYNCMETRKLFSISYLKHGVKFTIKKTSHIGCTSGMVYNGKEVDETFESHHFHVSTDCPCRSVIDCENNGTCVDEDPPYCLCPDGFIGALCEKVPGPDPVEGNYYK